MDLHLIWPLKNSSLGLGIKEQLPDIDFSLDPHFLMGYELAFFANGLKEHWGPFMILGLFSTTSSS